MRLLWVSVALRALEPELVWEYKAEGAISGIAFYPTVEAPANLIVVTDAGQAVFLDGHGKPEWIFDAGATLNVTPAVVELDGAAPAEIIIATDPGAVIALSRDGRELWRHALEGFVREHAAPCAADLDGDGRDEIVAGGNSGWLTCLSPEGKRLWRYRADAFRASAAAIADVDGDGKLDIVYGTENDHIVCLERDGRVKWISRQPGQFGRANPALGDLDGDGRYELTMMPSFNTPHSRIIAVNAEDGSLLWEAPMRLHGYVGNAICDLDGDGALENIVWNRANTVHCFNADGSPRWATITGGHAYLQTGVVADLTGDGRCEIVGGVRQTNEDGKSWFVLNDQGALLGAYAIPGGAPIAPVVGDIDRDGRIDLIIAGAAAGLVRCYTFGGPSAGARIAWPSPRYDAKRTGALPLDKPAPRAAQAPSPGKLQAAWQDEPGWGENWLRVEPPTGLDAGYLLDISVTGPHGRREGRALTIESGRAPEAVAVTLTGAGKHLVEASVRDAGTGRAIGVWNDTIRLSGVKSYVVRAHERLDSLERTADTLVSEAPETARLLSQRRAQAEAALDTLAKRVVAVDWDDAHAADAVTRDVVANQHALERDAALAARALAAQGQSRNAPIAIWEDPNPWDNTDPLADEVELSAAPVIEIWLYRNEYENRAIHVLNLRPEPVSVQVRPSSNAIDSLSFHEVTHVPRADGSWVGDALPPLNAAGILRLAPGEVRTLWVTARGGSSAGTAEYPVTLKILSEDDFVGGFTLRLITSALDMAAAPPWRVCNWSSPAQIKAYGLDMSAIETAHEHGVNIFTLGLPSRRCDERGNLVGKANWEKLDEELAALTNEDFLLFHSHGADVPEGVEEYGAIHVKATRAWLTEVERHLETLGWPKNRWALYPVDEPGLFGGTRIELFRRIATHLKEARPDLLVYANPAGAVTIENMTPIAHLVDIWCPEQQLLRRQPELPAFFKGTGKTVWSYEAPPLVKNLLPLGYYRANPWMAFQLGLTGSGFWTQIFPHNDLWMVRDKVDYGANYAGLGQEVISRRWEAFRDGIEDARAFRMLEETVEAAQARGATAGVVDAAQRLLREKLAEQTRGAWVTNDITRELREYDLDYAEVQRIRSEAEALTLQLRGAQGN